MEKKYSEWQAGNVLPTLSGVYERRVPPFKGRWLSVLYSRYNTDTGEWTHSILERPSIPVAVPTDSPKIFPYTMKKLQWRGLL